MVKITRQTQKIFAGEAPSDELAVFGSMKTGTPIYTNDVSQLQSSDYQQGWQNAIITDKAPFLEEMNGVQFGMSRQLAYLFQSGIPEYDANTTYYKDSFCRVDNKLYISLTDDNIGNDPAINTDNWKVASLGGGSSAKIGDIGFAPYVDETTNERRRLNGQVLIKDQYPAFVTWLTSLQATTPSLFATEDEWQSIKTASKLGQCGKFVIGDTTIRLPQVVNINGLVDMSNAGLIKDESLPDSNSKLYSAWGANVGTGGNQSIIAQNVSGSPQSTAATGPTYIKVDNPTYQDNAPVQQEAIQYPYYITVNTGSETIEPTINDYTVTTAYQYGISQYYKGIMNSGAWLRSNGQMNPKATYEGLYNWALTQLNAGAEGFKSSTASDITDYDFEINQTNETFRLPLKNGMEGMFASGTVPINYNLYYYCGNVEENPQLVNVARIEESLIDKIDYAQGARASMPSNRYEDLTLLASGQTYIAPADGYFLLSKLSNEVNQYMTLGIDKLQITTYSPSANKQLQQVSPPVRKGDAINVAYDLGGNTNYFRFYYAEGVANT